MRRSFPFFLVILSLAVVAVVALVLFRLNPSWSISAMAGGTNSQQITKLERQVKNIKKEIAALERKQSATFQERENALLQLRQLESSMSSLKQSLNVDTKALYNLQNNADGIKKN